MKEGINMKKIISIIFLSVFAVSVITGCSNGVKSETSNTEQKTAVVTSDSDGKNTETSQNESSEYSNTDKKAEESKSESKFESKSESNVSETETQNTNKVDESVFEKGTFEFNDEQKKYIETLNDEERSELDEIRRERKDMPYRVLVLTGVISPDAHKLTVDDLKEIIEKAKSDTSLETKEQKCLYIVDEIKKIQPVCDYFPPGSNVPVKQYWTDGTSLETVKNVIEVYLSSIFVHKVYENGKCVSNEVLYDPFNGQ